MLVDNWTELRVPFETLADGLFSDVVLLVGPQKHRFPAHKAILAAHSPYFRSLFFGTMRESDPAVREVALLLDTLEPELFADVLRFMYSGRVSLAADRLVPIAAAALYLRLDSLHSAVLTYAASNVGPVESVALGAAAHEANLPELAAVFSDVLRTDFRSVVFTEHARPLTAPMWRQLFAEKPVGVEMLTVGLLEWGAWHAEQQRLPLSEVLRDVLDAVPVGDLGAAFVGNVLAPTGLFGAEVASRASALGKSDVDAPPAIGPSTSRDGRCYFQIVYRHHFESHPPEQFDLVDFTGIVPVEFPLTATFEDLKVYVAATTGVLPRFQRIWRGTQRKNGTYRFRDEISQPAKPLQSIQPFTEQPYTRRVFVDIPPPECRVSGFEFDPMGPHDMLLFVKVYEPRCQQLRYAGHTVIASTATARELQARVSSLLRLPPGERPLLAYDEESRTQQNFLQPDDTLAQSFITGGDIIVFQPDPMADASATGDEVPAGGAALACPYVTDYFKLVAAKRQRDRAIALRQAVLAATQPG